MDEARADGAAVVTDAAPAVADATPATAEAGSTKPAVVTADAASEAIVRPPDASADGGSGDAGLPAAPDAVGATVDAAPATTPPDAAAFPPPDAAAPPPDVALPVIDAAPLPPDAAAPPPDLPTPPECVGDSQCNDANPCTVDACRLGRCQHDPAPAGTVCRPSAGPCDVAETCSSAACPADT